MLKNFPDIYVGIMQEDVGISLRTLQYLQKIIFHIFIRVAAVDKSKVNGGKLQGFELREEFITAHLIMFNKMVNFEATEMTFYFVTVIPESHPTYSFKRAVF